jgi:hypothetical protein
MSELHLQDKFLIPFFRDELGYQEVKANTITNSLIIEEDLQAFIATTELNQKSYEILLKKYSGNASKLLVELIELIQDRIASSRNMALFINANKSVPSKASNCTCSTPTTASSTTAASLPKTSSPLSKNCPTNTNIKADKSSPSAPISASSSTASTSATAN